MNLIDTINGYDFYVGADENGKSFYNVLPIGSPAPSSGYYNSDYITRMKGVGNIFNLRDTIREQLFLFEEEKWIPKNLKKGRCTPMPNPDCPEGSRQYNLAKTFKKHHGFHDGE